MSEDAIHTWSTAARPAAWPLIIAAFVGAGLVVLLLDLTNEVQVGATLATVIVALLALARSGAAAQIERSAASRPRLRAIVLTAATLGAVVALRDNDYGLLMLATVLVYVTVCLGLTIQMGYVGVTNFAGAAFLGVGGYTAALLGRYPVSDLLTIAAGGVMAALCGLVLTLPLLRTRGHYASLTTLAFGILFNVFLDASAALGGPQGLKLPGVALFGYDFANDVGVGGLTGSFYVNYVAIAAVLATFALWLAGALDRSWIGIWLDAVRLDETAASVSGIRIGTWKVVAFMLGNLLIGMAGALYAKMTGFIAPNNFTLTDSLVMVSIIILGGIGNRWGVLPACVLVVLLPEKLQFIQEYRLFIYAVVVIAILVLRPAGFFPRRLRNLSEVAR